MSDQGIPQIQELPEHRKVVQANEATNTQDRSHSSKNGSGSGIACSVSQKSPSLGTELLRGEAKGLHSFRVLGGYRAQLLASVCLQQQYDTGCAESTLTVENQHQRAIGPLWQLFH
jgi:hypothetical protein